MTSEEIKSAYEWAQKCYENKDFEEALNQLNEILKFDDAHFLALDLQARVYYQLKSYDLAFTAAEKSYELDAFGGLLQIMGDCCLQLKQYNEAVQYLSRYLTVQSNSANALWSRYLAYQGIGQHDLAEKDKVDALCNYARNNVASNHIPTAKQQLEEVLASKPNHKEALVSMCYLMETENEPEGQLKYAQLLESHYAEDVDVQFTLAKANLAISQLNQCTDVLNRILEKTPDYLPAERLLVNSFLQQKKYREALAITEQLLKKVPHDITLMYQQLELQQMLIDSFEEDSVEEKHYKISVLLNQQQLKAAKNEIDALPDGIFKHYFTALFHEGSKDFETAATSIQTAFNQYPNEITVEMLETMIRIHFDTKTQYNDITIKWVHPRWMELDSADILVKYGYAFIREKDHQQALSVFTRAKDMAPDYWWALCGLGDTLYKLDQFDEALTCYYKAHDLADTYYGPIEGLRDTYFAQQKYELAIDWGKRLQQSWPNDAHNYYKLGESCFQLNRYQDAEVWLKIGVQKDPNDYWLAKRRLQNAGYIQPNPCKTADYEQLVSKYPNDEHVSAIAADYYMENGYWADGILNYTKAIERNPDNSGYYVNRGYCYEQQFQSKKALADFQRGLMLSPHNLDTMYRVVHSATHLDKHQLVIEVGQRYINEAHYDTPLVPKVMLNMAQAFAALNQPEKAKEWVNHYQTNGGSDEKAIEKILNPAKAEKPKKGFLKKLFGG